MAACSIDLITNTEVSGVTSTLIGSARIIAGTNTEFSFRAMMGTGTLTTATLEIRRFTGGGLIDTLIAVGALQDVTSAIPVAIPADDWYEFYLYGSTAPTVSLVKGIRVVLS